MKHAQLLMIEGSVICSRDDGGGDVRRLVVVVVGFA